MTQATRRVVLVVAPLCLPFSIVAETPQKRSLVPHKYLFISLSFIHVVYPLAWRPPKNRIQYRADAVQHAESHSGRMKLKNCLNLMKCMLRFSSLRWNPSCKLSFFHRQIFQIRTYCAPNRSYDGYGTMCLLKGLIHSNIKKRKKKTDQQHNKRSRAKMMWRLRAGCCCCCLRSGVEPTEIHTRLERVCSCRRPTRGELFDSMGIMLLLRVMQCTIFTMLLFTSRLSFVESKGFQVQDQGWWVSSLPAFAAAQRRLVTPLFIVAVSQSVVRLNQNKSD